MTTKLMNKVTGIQVALMTITPDDARKYIATSERNRPINQRRVERYAKDMLVGNWSPATLLIIDEDGHMVDAHHRMEAVIEANIPVQMCVLTGLPKRYIPCIDTGRPRSAGDMLAFIEGLDGIGSLRNKAAMVRMLLAVKNGAAPRAHIASYNDIAEYMLENKELVNAAYEKYTGVKPLGATIGAGAAAFMIMSANGSECEQFKAFWKEFEDGEMLEKGSPSLALRNAVFANGKTGRGGTRQVNDMFFVLKAWRAYVSGEPIQLLRRPKEVATADLYAVKVSE